MCRYILYLSSSYYWIPDIIDSNIFKFSQRHDGISEVVVYAESVRDLTRIPVWEFHEDKFDFWERGRVEIPKFEDYKIVVTAVRGSGSGELCCAHL